MTGNDIYILYIKTEDTKAHMTHPASRFISLIMLLQRHPNQKAASLAQELGISVRSLHRYIEGLDEIGIPVYSERGPNGGFSLVRGYKLPPLIFTAEEAVVVALGATLVQEMWGALYREAGISALAKLETLLPEAQRQEVAWARRSLIAAGIRRNGTEILAPHLELLRQAMHDHRRVNMSYKGTQRSEALARTVDPYAIMYRWGWWYLVGYCHRRAGMRLFRLDRMKELTLLETTFTPKADFDARTFAGQEFTGQPQIEVRLLFHPAMAQVARSNGFSWLNQEEQPDGSMIVTMAAPDVTWAASMAISFGPGVTVLGPEETRSEVRRWAEAIAAQYS